MYCQYCGKPLNDGAKFCGSCGGGAYEVPNAQERYKTTKLSATEDKDRGRSIYTAFTLVSMVAFALFLLCAMNAMDNPFTSSDDARYAILSALSTVFFFITAACLCVSFAVSLLSLIKRRSGHSMAFLAIDTFFVASYLALLLYR